MNGKNKKNLDGNGIAPNIHVSLVNRRTTALLLSVVILFSVINPVVLAASSRGLYDSSVIWVEDVDSGDMDSGDVDSGVIDSGGDTPDIDEPDISEPELVDSGVVDSGAISTRAALLAKVYVGTGGSDNNSGISEATRVLSLHAAFDKVKDGGIIYVKGSAAFLQLYGNYYKDIDKSVTVVGMDDNRKSVFEIRQRLVFVYNKNITFNNITIKQMTSAGDLAIGTGAALDITTANVVLDNADIVGSYFSKTGVLRVYNGGTIRMKNGSKITGCTSANIVAVNKGTFIMEPGTEISGCNGTAVKIASGQNLTVEGTIKDNAGTGADIADNAGTIKIGSGAVIADNISGGKPDNMYLGENNQIKIQSSLTAGADINITPHSTMTSGTVIATGADADKAKCFKLENKKSPTYNLVLKGSELQLVQEMFVKAGAADGDGSMAKPLSSLSEAVRLTESSTKAPVAINLLSDMTTAGQILINKNIVLQGRSEDNTADSPRAITRTVGYAGTAIQVTGGTTELKNITVDGENNGTAPLLRVNGGEAAVILGENTKLCNNIAGGARVDAGTLTMKDGSTITGNSVAPGGMGDGIYVAQAGVLNLYGGVIELGSGAESKAGDIYGGGTINISGAPRVADIHLPVAKTIKIVGTLTGAAGSIGFTVMDKYPTENTNRMRIFATGSTSADDLARFKWNDRMDIPANDTAPFPEPRRIGTDLAITNFSRDARLSALTRDGILAAGEAAPVVPKVKGSEEDFKAENSDNTTIEKLWFEIPYSVGKTTMTVRAALSDNKYATVGTDIQLPTTRETFAPGKPIVIDVPYDPTKIPVGGEVVKLTMNATSHYGTPTKAYEVSFVRGAPKLTGNNTVNVNFNSDDATNSPVAGTVVIDKLRGDGVIDSGRFAIRVAEDTNGTTNNIEGVKVIGFDNTKGELTVEVTRAFAEAKVTPVNTVISAGRRDYSLWVDGENKDYNLGKVIINMTKASGKLVLAFTEISGMDWGERVYPKNAYIRAEDVPRSEQDRAWPSDGNNLLEEDGSGNWGYINIYGNFVALDADIPDDPDYPETYIDQVGVVKRKLEKEAKAMVIKTINEIAEKHGVLPPEAELNGRAGGVGDVVRLPAYEVKVISEYKPAINPDPYNWPEGQTGLYTFRIDIILKSTEGGADVGVAGVEHTIPVHPKKLEGITELALSDALQNAAGTGALDGEFPAEIWVNPNASGKEISEAVIKDVLDKPGSPIKKALQRLEDTDKFEGFTIQSGINPEEEAEPLETDGVNSFIYLIVRAFKTDCEKSEDGEPLEKYTTVVWDIPVKLKITTNVSETGGQIIIRHAEKEIRDALNTGKLTLGDLAANAVPGKTEAGAMAYVRDKVTEAIATPAGATLYSSLTTNGKPDGTPALSVTLGKPLRDMVKVNVTRRELEQDAYRAAVNGNYINRTGVQGQYAFDITVTTLDGAQTIPVALTFSGSPVQAMTDGGSPFDDGIALLAAEYKTSGGGGGSGSGSGGIKPGDIEVVDPDAKPGVGEVTRPGTAGGRLPGQLGTGGQGGTTGTGGGTTGTGGGTTAGLGVGGTMLSQAKNVTITVPVETKGGIKAVLPDMEAVLRAILTPKEIKAAQDGESVEIELKVNRIADKDLSGTGNEDHVTIKAEAQKKKLTVGCYLNITLGKKISGGEWMNVTEAGEAIRVALDIPEELQKDGRVFSVARRHGGVVSFLPNLSTDKKTVIFETDRFSTYAIVYSDTAVEGKTEVKAEAEAGAKAGTYNFGGEGIGQNGADMNIALLGGYVLAGAVVVLVAVILVRRRRRG